ncbi:MAG: radical SAM/SPASM domain-containing protein [Candidatus Omnitrophota bacterium]|jgi:MoaA/NifB/PqqE/SkfB family radical SAM enzyme
MKKIPFMSQLKIKKRTKGELLSYSIEIFIYTFFYSLRKVIYPMMKKYYRGPGKKFACSAAKRYAEKKDIFIPRYIFLESTNLCNASCICCPHDKMTRPKEVMPWDLFKLIIDECKTFSENGLKKIFLNKDGEPLLDPLLIERIEYIKHNIPSVSLHLNSNAMCLDEEKAARLLDSALDSITFTVNGASRETYETIMRGLDYHLVKGNLERFFELKADRNSRLKVSMQIVVCDKNIHEVQKYNRQWFGKADSFVLKSMHNFFNMGTSIMTDKLSGDQLRFCAEPFEGLFIYCNGDLGLCCWDYDNLTGLGNVSKHGILNLYNNSRKLNDIRAAMLKMDCRNTYPCNRCSLSYGLDKNTILNALKRRLFGGSNVAFL